MLWTEQSYVGKSANYSCCWPIPRVIAREWKPGTAFPASRLLAADGFGGIDGIFRFNNRGIAVRALEVSEVGAGGFRVIDPAPTKW